MMMLKLYNTLTRKVDEFAPLEDKRVRIYSCGPTVYNHAHIGNLTSYIFADTLRRVTVLAGYEAHHVMNITDIDDKTIRDSRVAYPDHQANDALKIFTQKYEKVFYEDMQQIGNDLSSMTFIRATDSIDDMQAIIRRLVEQGYAYLGDDGVYFDIKAYRGTRTYGQLSHVTEDTTSSERISNDEYDKDSAHDFSLWKLQKEGEPSWEFEISGNDLSGRPGWHIECSAMSTKTLGQPFDIHTGGIDLIFPHHENEIAQSTAGDQPEEYANYFCHNEHLLIDGRKMSKSLGNFYTIKDMLDKNYDPLALRMLTLQSHYRSQLNFTWDNLEAAAQRLQRWRSLADLRWQTHDTLQNEDDKVHNELSEQLAQSMHSARSSLFTDINTPQAIGHLEGAFSLLESAPLAHISQQLLLQVFEFVDTAFGFDILSGSSDISEPDKHLIIERQRARENKEYSRSDELRDSLLERGITVRDTSSGPIWSRV
jgi:cysteinyl-tRNA synthetase